MNTSIPSGSKPGSLDASDENARINDPAPPSRTNATANWPTTRPFDRNRRPRPPEEPPRPCSDKPEERAPRAPSSDGAIPKVNAAMTVTNSVKPTTPASISGRKWRGMSSLEENE